jgi:hypothetical protein
MTEAQKELITIRKRDLLEFIASIGFQIEEYQNQNLTHGFEISGYQNAGDCFIIDCVSHSSAKSDAVLDDFEKKMSNKYHDGIMPIWEIRRELKELRQQER